MDVQTCIHTQVRGVESDRIMLTTFLMTQNGRPLNKVMC